MYDVSKNIFVTDLYYPFLFDFKLYAFIGYWYIKGYWRHFQTTFAHLVQEAESKGTVWSFSSGLPTQDSLAVQEEGSSQVQPPQILKDPFIQLDRLNDALWSLEKSGQLVIPGPSLPSFDGGDNSENALLGGAAGDGGLSSRDDRSSSQIEVSYFSVHTFILYYIVT